MKPLRPPDTLHLEAARGWLGLDNHLEANAELDEITPPLRTHPDVLAVRWAIYAKAEKWEACLDIGAALLKLAPQRPSSWLHHAAALHRLKRTHHAHDALLPAVRKFPKEWQVRYDLARYACGMGKLEEARAWLGQAFELGDQKKLKLMALEDPDLGIIWRGF